MQSSQRLINYFIHNAKPYFQEAEEFIALSDTYGKQYNMAMFDMYVSPLLMVLTILYTKKRPNAVSLLGLHRIIQSWIDYFRYIELRKRFHHWNQIINAVGGPYISTNDPTYHPYVIAEAMYRTQTSLFTNRKKHRDCPNPEIRT
jgi:hypothetical protein